MTNEQRKRLKELKGSCINSPKAQLLRVVSEMEDISPRQAEQLARIIARLEGFQHR